VTAEALARALGGRRVGSQWMAPCPGHHDKNPSLAICEGDGKPLLHCHAGCTQRAVIAALRGMGLWNESSGWREWRPGVRYHVDWGDPVAEYFYRDEKGAHLYSIVRFTPKDFRQGYPDRTARNGWEWKKHPRQVLYRLPEVSESAVVFVVEGEKDVESLRSHGFVATCNAGGANASWLPSYTQTLTGREVILIPDRDAPGRQRVLKIARALLGHAARIVVWEPDDKDAKDITDWFGLGHSELELMEELESVGGSK
jgi:5S rRNA maturation endonuclease (ribonuclease M5)